MRHSCEAVVPLLVSLVEPLGVTVHASPPDILSAPCIVVAPPEFSEEPTPTSGPPWDVQSEVMVLVVGQRTHEDEHRTLALAVARTLQGADGVQVTGISWMTTQVGTTTYPVYDVAARVAASL